MRAAKNELSLTDSKEALKVKLTKAPVDGEANKALVSLLAKSLNIKKSSVEITSGLKSRNKRVKLTGLRKEDVEEALERSLKADKA